ncbi:DUF1641 domain-containing protein [Haliangium ochraceum]|uniref:DUF1641 domain-containing protein n=1 Tax=Haliangium ochraceum (strain DSM 14365 / JCM 11303 / SMP-2) TaxID=502025 RepID=D0LJ44_HALO1|nr:DUF1641 domain-containing protein [Haliangium ochraceum]ACY14891.1 hypothetical protein Hoch_2353 [Haliangium ochraceum DSM 14365]
MNRTEAHSVPAPAGRAPASAASREERTLELLESIERRLARLESRLEPATQAIESAPATLATVADMVDEHIGDPAQLDRRVRALMPLVERLTRPDTLRALERAVDAIEQAPAMVATAADMLDEAIADPGELQTRLGALGPLLERLTRPATMRAMHSALDFAEQTPLTLATIVDTADQVIAAMAARGIHVDQLIRGTQKAAVQVAKLITSDEFSEVLDSGILDARVLPTLGAMARALAQASTSTQEKIGVLGSLRALRQPEVQSALGFLMHAASEFGAHRIQQPQDDAQRLASASRPQLED